MQEKKEKSFYTLNTWSDETMNEAFSYLEKGYVVHFGSTAIGHTMAQMVELDAIKKVKDKFGALAVIVKDSLGFDSFVLCDRN